ncbi:3',5'-cyclic-AMP phosphodiesterase [Acinetobacter sp. ABJ-A23_2]|uniref:3',5'-cyclic-AMP phosphodiesterase n=1 Tax=Acinetobacter sp. ABJ-A23_2 TaxID=3376991 RepID=UPI0037CAEFDE
MTFQVSTLSQKNHVIIQITDTHLLEYPQLEFVGMNPEESFHAIIQQILKQHPEADAIIHTGDLAQAPTPITYKRYINFMQTLGLPFFQTLGNHDNVDHFPLHNENHQEPVVVGLGNWRVIMLNSAVKGKVDGHLSSEQLENLTNLLEEFADHPVLLACHHHPFAMKSKWIDHHKLQNSNVLLDTLSPFKNVKALVCGHVHQDSLNIWQGIEFFSTPSTSVQFKPFSNDFALDQNAPGYRYIRLNNDGSFETKVFRLENFKTRINTDISGY